MARDEAIRCSRQISNPETQRLGIKLGLWRSDRMMPDDDPQVQEVQEVQDDISR
jgi:hypothetical protein